MLRKLSLSALLVRLSVAVLLVGTAIVALVGFIVDREGEAASTFWTGLHRMGFIDFAASGYYEDAATMQKESDIVVLGRVVEFHKGRMPGEFHGGRKVPQTTLPRDREYREKARSNPNLGYLDPNLINLTVRVDEVLDGDASLVRNGRLTNIELWPWFDHKAIDRSLLPSEPTIFFLRRQDLALQRDGLSQAAAAEWGRGFLEPTQELQGMQIAIDGRVNSPPQFNEGLQDQDVVTNARSLEEFAEEIRARAQTGGS